MKILLVAGARPNFMKIAPLIWELKKTRIKWKLVHTGQHYDYEMSKVFFTELEIPEPDCFLNAGTGEHARQFGRIMVSFETVCSREKPNLVVVVGDVNSTLACSIVAKKMGILLAHVEAGLRSRDFRMPEETNRLVTDTLSDYLFVSERSGIENLKKEGRRKNIFFVGNIMIDTLHYGLKKIKNSHYHKKLADIKYPYAVVTLHRPSNVDNKEILKGILAALKNISQDMAVYFPVHPRTKKNIAAFGLHAMIRRSKITLLPPLSYMEFLSLWKDAGLVLTDSGGIQEETTALQIPCFTLRENTERPITLTVGSNTLVGPSTRHILKAYENFKKGLCKKGRVPERWDGKTACRIVQCLEKL